MTDKEPKFYPNEPVAKRGFLGVVLSAVGIVLSQSLSLVPEDLQNVINPLIVLLGGGAGVAAGRNGAYGPVTVERKVAEAEVRTLKKIEFENIKASEDWEALLRETDDYDNGF